MKGSQELIEYFDMREKALGEKATEFNMFLEGYAEGYKDTKEFLIDKACEWLKRWFADTKYYTPQEALDSLRKYMED